MHIASMIADKETVMAKFTNPIQIPDTHDIERAVQRGRTLRSEAFATFLRRAYAGLFGRLQDEKPAIDRGYRDCTSAA